MVVMNPYRGYWSATALLERPLCVIYCILSGLDCSGVWVYPRMHSYHGGQLAYWLLQYGLDCLYMPLTGVLE
jgi:hypothetical protein